MRGLRATHAIAVGELLAVATVVHVAAVTSRDASMSMAHFAWGVGLLVGAPLGLPWLVLVGLERAPRDRPLGVVESVFCTLVLLYELGVFFVLPKALGDSEGFAFLPVWGISAVATLVLVFVNEFGQDAR
jgi:hypothetical protein